MIYDTSGDEPSTTTTNSGFGNYRVSNIINRQSTIKNLFAIMCVNYFL